MKQSREPTEGAGQKQAGATVFLVTELGKARTLCEKLVGYVGQGVRLIDKSSHRDHFYEVAGHLINGVPDDLHALQQKLEVVALAANRLDAETAKKALRPETVEELERATQDVRIRHVRSEPPMNQQTVAQELKAIVQETRQAGIPVGTLLDLVSRLESGVKLAAATASTADALEGLADHLASAKTGEVSRVQLARTLRKFVGENIREAALDDRAIKKELKEIILDAEAMKGDVPAALQRGITDIVRRAEGLMKKLASGEEKLAETQEQARHPEGEEMTIEEVTEGMSPEDAAKFKSQNEKNKDKFKSARYTGGPDKLLKQMKESVDALLNARVTFRPVHIALGELRRDATGTTGFNDVYEADDVKKVEKELYALDQTIGEVFRNVERLMKDLKKRQSKTAAQQTPDNNWGGADPWPYDISLPQTVTASDPSWKVEASQEKTAAKVEIPVPNNDTVMAVGKIVYNNGKAEYWYQLAKSKAKMSYKDETKFRYQLRNQGQVPQARKLVDELNKKLPTPKKGDKKASIETIVTPEADAWKA